MTGFLFKKFFYDLWDNLFFITVLNFGLLVSLFLVFLTLQYMFPALTIAGIIVLAVLVFWIFVYLCAVESVHKEISDYHHPVFADFLANLKGAFLPAAVLFAAAALIFYVLFAAVPAYLSTGSLAGMAAAFFSCWICLFVISSIQFYPAVYYRLGMRPLKCLKKCFLICFDNTGFCFFTLVVNIFFTLLFSPCWSLLYLDEALRLRLLKYDWLEAQAAKLPENDPPLKQGRAFGKKIPWNELLAEEKENTGTRNLKAFFLPWKE